MGTCPIVIRDEGGPADLSLNLRASRKEIGVKLALTHSSPVYIL